MNTEPIAENHFDVVWSGAMKHVTLGAALKGVEPFVGQPAEGTCEPAYDRCDKWAMPTGKLIVKILHERGPMNST